MSTWVICTQIKNLVNGKLYIGKTVGYKQRKYDHFKLLKAKKHMLFTYKMLITNTELIVSRCL
ncbi:MAG: GIY-YIG nuclease family protein [Saprospiraceae bacterium]|nr:GIY-YIG nuclease family protein [Saprospiraceae bacterium]